MVDGLPSICVDDFKIEKRRHHQSLTTVDVESTAILRRCQSPRYGRSFSRSTDSLNETSESTPTLSSSFGEHSKEFHLVRGPDNWETPVTGKRRESAPDFNSSDSNDSRPKIVIRLTSVEGLELNLTNSLQDNQLLPEAATVVVCPHRSIRVGATRPQPPKSSKPFLLFSFRLRSGAPLLFGVCVSVCL